MSNTITHQLYIRNANGDLLTVVQDGYFASLQYGLKENEPGVLEFTLPNTFDRTLLVIDGQVEVYRSYGNLGLVLEGNTAFFIRRITVATSANGVQSISVLAFSACEILSRRIVAYYSGSSYAEKSYPWDQLMKNIVNENFIQAQKVLSGSGTDTDRNIGAEFTTQTNELFPPTVSMSFAWRNVLSVLSEIAEVVRNQGTYACFDVGRVGDGVFQFQVFNGARGTDHSSDSAVPVVLSPERFNLLEPSLTEDWTQEANAIYGGGQGEGTVRIIQTATDPDRIGISPFGRREFMHDARNSELASSVLSEAQGQLEANRPKKIFTGMISQTEGCLYGVHWAWGDIVTAQYDGQVFDCHIEAIVVSVDANGTEVVQAYLRSETDA